MKKKIMAIALAVMMVVLCIPAIPTMASIGGTCGTNATWKINGNTLTISGTGQMTNYDSVYDTPWYEEGEAGNITKVVIEDGITHVGNCAFLANSSDGSTFVGLMHVSLGSTVKSIGSNAFYGCNLITKIAFPASLRKVKAEAFEGTGLRSVNVSKLTFIGARAFADCVDLTGTVTIGPSVTKYLDEAFSGSPISGYEVSASNATYSSLDGVLYNKAQTTLISFPKGKTVTTFTVPTTVTTIGKQAFYYAYNITNLVFPNNVKVVKEGALPASFSGNVALKNVYFGKGLTKLAATIFRPTSDADPCYKVYFTGNMPEKTGEGAEYWGWLAPVMPNNVRIYVPKGNSTWTDYINAEYSECYGTWFGKPAVKTLKNSAAGTVTATYSKSSRVTGYQLQYSLYSTFKTKKTVTIKGASVNTAKITGLKKGKKYYFRIRAYKKVGGASFTTAWSAKKAITLTK